MLHCFRVSKTYLLLDTESGALHEVDAAVYKIVNNLPLSAEESQAALEVKAELEQLEREGLANALPINSIKLPPVNLDVKSLCLHLTHDCNLSCGYCFAEDFCTNKEYMSSQTGHCALDFLFASSGKNTALEIDFFGGEPLMNFKLLQELVEYGKELAKKHNKTIKFTTTTNGVLLTKEISDYLDAEMDNIVLSIDGSKETNDKVRKTKNGGGSYDLILKNFKYLANKREERDYFVRGTYTHLNPNFCPDVLHLADCGFRSVSVEPVVLEKNRDLALNDQDIETACLAYEEFADEYLLRRKDGRWFSFFHFVMDIDNGPCLTKRLLGCGAGTQYLAVTPNGDIFPCHQLAGNEKYKIGNVAEKKLDNQLRKKIGQSNVLTKPMCANCWAKYYCSGGCIANAINFCGDLSKPYEYGCKLMKKRLECAFYVAVMEKR